MTQTLAPPHDPATPDGTRREGLTLTVPARALAKAVAAVLPTSDAKQTGTVFGALRLRWTDGTLTLETTNGAQYARVAIAAPAGTSETFAAVPARKFAELVDSLTGETVRLSTTSTRVVLTQERTRLALARASDDAPTWPTPSGPQFRLPRATLLQLGIRAAFAASQREDRPVLRGVLLTGRFPGVLTAVGTDGHRLALERVACALEAWPDMIVPAGFFEHVARIFADVDELTVTVDVSAQHIRVEGEGYAYASTLIAGPFPAFEAVIPDAPTTRVRVTRAAFRQSVKRVGLIASDQTHRVRLSVGAADAPIAVATATPDLGEATDDLMAERIDGPAVVIGFNAAYLVEGLGMLDDTTVELAFTGPERAALLRPLDASGVPREGSVQVLMPLRLD